MDRVRGPARQPDGAIALVSASATEWFPKTYSVYGSAHDDDHYLNYTKAQAVAATADVLALKLLESEVTLEAVAAAVPPIRKTGVRSALGSRGSVADTSFSDAGEDAAGYGFPPALSYVFNLTNIAEGGAPIADGTKYVNSSAMADGASSAATSPVVFYYPIVAGSPYLPPGTSNSSSRYWTMVASPEADMGGSREQTVWLDASSSSSALGRRLRRRASSSAAHSTGTRFGGRTRPPTPPTPTRRGSTPRCSRIAGGGNASLRRSR